MKPILMATTALAFLAPATLTALPAVAATNQAEAVTAVASDKVAETVSPTTIVITARRRAESVQTVPISVSVLSGAQLEKTGTYNVEQLTRVQPSLQFISTNPRNTAVTIRGLGSNIGLTNDGLEPGVGIYVDDVYFARPGSAVVDLLDLDRIEVLRGPQGTLFGKNTTAGALNLITAAPTFTPEGSFEVKAGNYGLVQGKAIFSGPLTDKIAGRLAFSATHRNGVLYNTTTKTHQNEISNEVARGELLIQPSDDIKVRLSYDYAFQNPDAQTQVFVRYGPTLRPANTQFPYLAAQAGYAPPSTNPYDRLTDVNSPLEARQVLQGASARVDWKLGDIDFTSISAVRAWDWTPQNDRDYTALSIRTKSNNASKQNQWSQEFRLSGKANRVTWVAGLYGFGQTVETHGIEQWGKDAALWLIGSSVPANLLDGYQAPSTVFTNSSSYAAFGQTTWDITDKLHLTTGLRYTIEHKSVDYSQVVSGGLATTDANLISKKNGIARNQAYAAAFKDSSPTGLVSVSYDLAKDILTYAIVSKGYKSAGINAAGLPTDSAGNPSLTSAIIKPENTVNVEAGVKTQFLDRTVTFNVGAYSTDIRNYQANVVDTGPGSLRGYLANAEKVTVRGVDIDAAWRPTGWFNSYATLSYTDGKYASFKNAPPPLEFLTATTAAYDLSGQALPGVSKWSGSVGAEAQHAAKLGTLTGHTFAGFDLSYRSEWNSDASVSKYALIKASTLLNLRFGFASDDGFEASVWVKNAADAKYLAFTTIQAGNSGAVYGQPGDPRTLGVTVKKSF